MELCSAMADHVPMRQDVLRGFRLGAVIFAAMLLGVAVFRITHGPHGSPAPDPALQSSEVATTPPAETPLREGPPVVPAPPPLSRPQIRRHSARQATAVAEAVPAVSTNAAPSPDETAAPAEPAQPESVVADTKDSTAPVVGASEEAAAIQESRRKRWAKAVGRFLHVTPKKDVQPSAVRPPQQ
jgi:hypothetical protein